MRLTTTLALAFVLSACDQQGYGVNPPSGDDTDVTDTSEPVDTQEPLPSTACHASDPIDQMDWTRTYQVNWEGNQGTETVTPQGEGVTSGGTDAYLIQTELVTGDSTLTTVDYRGCDANGRAVWYESDVEGTSNTSMDDLGDLTDLDPMELFELFMQLFAGGDGMGIDLLNLHDPGVPYLGDNATVSGGGAVQFAYELMSIGQTADLFNIPNCAGPGATENNATCVEIEGSLTFMGTTEVVVPAGTFTAYRVLEDRLEKWSDNSLLGDFDLGDLFPMPGFGASEDQRLISDKYYVPGIGLVKEQTKYENAAPGEWLVERELTNYTGLQATN